MSTRLRARSRSRRYGQRAARRRDSDYLFLSRFNDSPGDLGTGTFERANVPGPGTIEFKATVNGTWNIGTTNVGKLTYTGATSGNVCRSVESFSRASGRMLLYKHRRVRGTTVHGQGLWKSPSITTVNDVVHRFRVSGNHLSVSEGPDSTVTFDGEVYQSDGTVYEHALVLRDAGALYFLRGGAWGSSWQLVHLTDFETAGHDANAGLYFGQHSDLGSVDGWLDDIRVPKRLWNPAPQFEGTEFPQLVPVECSIGSADFVLDVTFTRQGIDGVAPAVTFRDQNTSNRWTLVAYPDDGSVRIILITPEEETDEFTFASSIGTGQTRMIRVMCYGSTIRPYFHTPGTKTWTAATGTVTGRTTYQTEQGITVQQGSGDLLIDSLRIWKRSWRDFPNL